MASFLVYGGTLEAYLSQFEVEKLEMVSVMGICGSLVGPKSGNVEKVLVFKAFLNGQRGDEHSKEVLRPSGRTGFEVILGSLWCHFGVTLGSLGSF